ncbi:AraC family transcriptional regulator ligand-binding domain-containing protein [Paucibacter sp. R3-3]|uniref:AraC family transcriptional regulator ligand-binding domain-containing protein n=1 Tax=Roseateles agri TaxID=3098619 RepID=A0ABU5D9J0_9BURK|nr:AraC family transcriptional regulator ligand-binding domain-containing protein [Paucibacter sp. R3-3]MDY0742939.1 AraC family transcriptional regulator ligand-binding domain-containing protein [Paucibacter sp. R3-3]
MSATRIPMLASTSARFTALGLDSRKVLARAGLSPAVTQRGSLDTPQFFAVWHAILELSGDPLIGLRIGSETGPAQLEAAAIAALHSATFGDALARLARYKRLCCPEEIRVEREGPLARLSFHWILADEITPHAISDAAFASAHAIARRGAGHTITPRRLELMRTPPSVAPYAAHFGCEVRTGCAGDALVYDAAALEVPFVSHNEDLLAVLVPALDAQVEALGEIAIEKQARAALTRLMRGDRPSIETLARQLNMSTRSLQRRLGDAGTSYQAVLDGVRLETARRLLAETSFTPGEIAFFLGFEEANSFQRAFRRWEGRTPIQWREERAPQVLGQPGGRRKKGPLDRSAGAVKISR